MAASLMKAQMTRNGSQTPNSSGEQEVMRCQQMRKIVEGYLIGSCGDDGVTATWGDGEVRERMHARHTAKLNFILLALAEVFDGVIGSDCHRTVVLEYEQVFAALRAAAQLPITPHVVDDRAAGCRGPGEQGIVAALG